MPIYEYSCCDCNLKYEELVSGLQSEEKLKCPSCGSMKKVRAFSTFYDHSSKNTESLSSAQLSGGSSCSTCSSSSCATCRR
ncbi:MAG: zinc ribbon domain-containing protein [Actinobacteria bacterium]|nr:zinc ribbon domain-containing protein [Actinomycetota bacterium]